MRSVVMIVAASLLSFCIAPLAAQSKCSAAPEYRQMDFWIGTWDTAP